MMNCLCIHNRIIINGINQHQLLRLALESFTNVITSSGKVSEWRERERNQSNKLLKCIYITVTAMYRKSIFKSTWKKRRIEIFPNYTYLFLFLIKVTLYWLMSKFQIISSIRSFTKKTQLSYRSTTWSITNCNCLFWFIDAFHIVLCMRLNSWRL